VLTEKGVYANYPMVYWNTLLGGYQSCNIVCSSIRGVYLISTIYNDYLFFNIGSGFVFFEKYELK